jgi:hypothetical protein
MAPLSGRRRNYFVVAIPATEARAFVGPRANPMVDAICAANLIGECISGRCIDISHGECVCEEQSLASDHSVNHESNSHDCSSYLVIRPSHEQAHLDRQDPMVGPTSLSNMPHLVQDEGRLLHCSDSRAGISRQPVQINIRTPKHCPDSGCLVASFLESKC